MEWRDSAETVSITEAFIDTFFLFVYTIILVDFSEALLDYHVKLSEELRWQKISIAWLSESYDTRLSFEELASRTIHVELIVLVECDINLDVVVTCITKHMDQV